MLRGQRRQIVHRDIVFAARGAQREQPFLDAVELARIVVRRAQRRVEVRARLVERGQRRIERLRGRIDQGGRLRAPPLQPAQRSRERGDRRAVARDRLVRVAQVFGHLVDRHHGGALFGERGLLACLGLEFRQFLDRVAQPIGLAPRLLDARAVGRNRLLGGAPFAPQPRNRRGIVLKVRIGIEQPPVRRDIDQRALVMLTVDFHQRAAQRLQDLHAHRLIVDEGARAPVAKLHAPQDQPVFGSDAVIGEQRERRMVALDLEGGRDLPLLGAVAHKARVAAAAERKREGIEQDRLARAGFAGEHRQAGRVVDVEPFDQDDVTNRETGEHFSSFRGAGDSPRARNP